MQTYLDCVPCFVRQALEAVRFVSDDPAVHAAVLRRVLRGAAEMDLHQAPPAMGRLIHRFIRDATGDGDPYRAVKQQFNRLALGMYPALKATVARSASPLETAVRLAIAGNIIDFGITASLTEATVRETMERALREPLIGSVDSLGRQAERADEVLYLTDNAGEIVFDRVLIETLPAGKVTVAVKGSPVINDATFDDAVAAGLTECCEVIDNGSDGPGTLLETCSVSFRQRFDRADLIIAKGQGNYETLSDVPRPIVFLLMAKCPVIARDIGCAVGSLVARGAGPADG